YRDAVAGEAVRVVDRPVKWVDDPAFAAAGRLPQLFAHDDVVGVRLTDDPADALFAEGIDPRDEVDVARLHLDLQIGIFLRQLDTRGLARRAYSCSQVAVQRLICCC